MRRLGGLSVPSSGPPTAAYAAPAKAKAPAPRMKSRRLNSFISFITSLVSFREFAPVVYPTGRAVIVVEAFLDRSGTADRGDAQAAHPDHHSSPAHALQKFEPIYGLIHDCFPSVRKREQRLYGDQAP